MGNPRQGHMPVAVKWHYILEHDDPSTPAGFRPSEARSRSLNQEPPPLATCPPPTPQGVPLPPPSLPLLLVHLFLPPFRFLKSVQTIRGWIMEIEMQFFDFDECRK